MSAQVRRIVRKAEASEHVLSGPPDPAAEHIAFTVTAGLLIVPAVVIGALLVLVNLDAHPSGALAAVVTAAALVAGVRLTGALARARAGASRARAVHRPVASCRHGNRVPVLTVLAEHVADLCPDCDAQLAPYKARVPPTGPSGVSRPSGAR